MFWVILFLDEVKFKWGLFYHHRSNERQWAVIGKRLKSPTRNSVQVWQLQNNKSRNNGVSVGHGSHQVGVAFAEVGVEDKADAGHQTEDNNLAHEVDVEGDLAAPEVLEAEASVDQELGGGVRGPPQDHRSEDQVPEGVALEQVGARVVKVDPWSLVGDPPDLRDATGPGETPDQDGQESAQDDEDLENVLKKLLDLNNAWRFCLVSWSWGIEIVISYRYYIKLEGTSILKT